MSGSLLVAEMNVSKALKEVFSSADEYKVGLVRSNDLVNKLRTLVPKADVDLNILQNLLDPKRDNVQVPEVEFLEIGSKWLEHQILKSDPNQIDSRPHELGFPYNSNEWKTGNTMDFSAKINGSFLASNSVDSDQDPVDNTQVTDLVKEVKQLEDALSRVSDEKMSVQQQLCVLEDSFSNLDTENKRLRSALTAKEKSLNTILSYQMKYDDLKEAMQGMEEESSHLQLSNFDMQKELDVLSEDNKRLKKELISSQEITSKVRENHQEALDINETQVQELEKARSVSESNQIELKKLKQQLCTLEESLDDEKARNQELRSELDFLEGNLEFYEESRHEATELDRSFENPKRTSTLSLEFNDRLSRNSIGDEIRQVFMKGESPFCEKFVLSQFSTEMEDQETQTVNDVTNIEDKKGVEAHVQKTEFFKLKVPIKNSVQARNWCILAIFLCLLDILFFTFFGAIEVNNVTLFPITWQSERNLPEPFIAFKYQIERRPFVW